MPPSRHFVVSSVLVLAACCMLSCGVSGDPLVRPPVNTPPDGDNGTDFPNCKLFPWFGTGGDDGNINKGILLSNKYTYPCTTVATILQMRALSPIDNQASAEIFLDGVPIHIRDNNLPDGDAISSVGGVASTGPNGVPPYSPIYQNSRFMNIYPGWNNVTIGVWGRELEVGPTCYYEYKFNCWKNPPPPITIIGDPQFVGLRGQNYQIHGVSGEIYNIVSDADLQYNSRFVFLDQGECPVINGRKQKGCFSHPGSYLGELGLKTRAGDRIHVSTGSAKDGFSGIELNGKALEVGDSILLAGDLGSVSFNDTHIASVQVGQWSFVFENSDMYLNQRVRVLDSRHLRSHGLLGQTWRETVYPNAIKYIQGVVDGYVIRDADIFGDSFVYNTFN